MLGDPDRPQFGEHIIKPQEEERRRNAPLATFSTVGILLIGGAVALTFFLSNEVGALMMLIFRVIYFVFLGIYILFAGFASYHMFRYGFKGDQSIISTFIFISLALILGAIGIILAALPVKYL